LSTPVRPTTHVDDDAEHLRALGIEQQHFKREMSLLQNFSLGFTYLSPIVGVYTLFAYAMATAGPPFWWAFLGVGLGQLLVAMTFSEVVSQYPVAGGIYPWARRLWGRKYAWMTGWMYLWALAATTAALAYGGGPYASDLFGVEINTNNSVIVALIFVAIALFVNFMGTRWVARVAFFGFVAEILGTIVVGAWLLIGHREHGLGVLFDSYGAGAGKSYISAWVAGALIAMWLYYGFEACGDVAEEVPDPSRRIPKAMRYTIYVGGASASFFCLALVLGVTDYAAIISGEQTDPITTLLNDAFGTVGAKIILAVVLISFFSCTLSLMAATNRLLYSYARDKMIVGHKYLSYFWEKRHVPPYAMLVSAIIPSCVILIALFSTDAEVKLVSFAACGIYVAFQMNVLAALQARLRGWKPAGKWTMGRYGLLVNTLALIYGLSAIVNMCWPRSPGTPWYTNYIVILGLAIVSGLGIIFMFAGRLYAHGDQPYSDAIKNIDYRAKAAQATSSPAIEESD
jgi:amino acid transporter